tara:strand:- start:1826 stop:2863 length:1038 start_codon:yes stop_codon:yes gene_type:complete
MINVIYLILPILIFLINNFCKKNNLISNYTGERHQKFLGKKNIPLTGGIFLTLISVAIFYNNYLLFSIFLFIITILGFISDIKLLSSPRLRFLIQSITIIIFVYFMELNIETTRVFLLDFLLKNLIFNIIFITFCLTIIINGTNFIDGLNGLVLGYFLLISIVIFKLDFFYELQIEKEQLVFFIFLLFCLFVFNIYNKLYLGDSGAYALGFIFSFFLITIYQNNQSISPFYIVLLLWYPAFENLFSIIRKFRIKKSPVFPDSKHLHQLLFNFIKKKFKKRDVYSNNLSSLIILFYNLCIFIAASVNIYETQYQIILIFINVTIYVVAYIRLFNFSFNIKAKINKK